MQKVGWGKREELSLLRSRAMSEVKWVVYHEANGIITLLHGFGSKEWLMDEGSGEPVPFYSESAAQRVADALNGYDSREAIALAGEVRAMMYATGPTTEAKASLIRALERWDAADREPLT